MTSANTNQNAIQQTDVIIVGAGPIGLSMARMLAGCELSVHIVEGQPQQSIANPDYDGREIAITHRTKEMMHDLDQWRHIDQQKIHFLKRAEVYDGNSPFAMGFDKPDTVRGKPIETLGYLLSNNRIRKAAYDALTHDEQTPHYLTTHFGQRVKSVTTSDECAQVTLENGTVINGRLVLAADSRVSFMRKALGISADMHDFGRTVLVFRTEHTLTNHETAHEGFYYGKTLAVLPLGGYESSMVITVDNSQVERINAMSKQELASEMSAWLDGRLGEITVTGDIHSYPLLGVHADKFYGKRSALIGDAAVGMHPVTAHGYNLGMESVAILGKLLIQAAQNGEDIANPQILARYHRIHSTKTRAMYHGTNAIVKLYTDERPLARSIRKVGLRLGNSFTPVKRLITAQLTG